MGVTHLLRDTCKYALIWCARADLPRHTALLFLMCMLVFIADRFVIPPTVLGLVLAVLVVALAVQVLKCPVL